MGIALGILVIVSVVGTIVLFRLFVNAPMGYEDEDGFHLGEK